MEKYKFTLTYDVFFFFRNFSALANRCKKKKKNEMKVVYRKRSRKNCVYANDRRNTVTVGKTNILTALASPSIELRKPFDDDQHISDNYDNHPVNHPVNTHFTPDNIQQVINY